MIGLSLRLLDLHDLPDLSAHIKRGEHTVRSNDLSGGSPVDSAIEVSSEDSDAARFRLLPRQRPANKKGRQTHFPAKPSFDQKSNLIIFSGTLNFFLLMMRSSYSMAGRTGSSGTTVIFPLFDSPAEETSTISNFSRIVRLFFYTVSVCSLFSVSAQDKMGWTNHNLFSVIWTHPFLPTIRRYCQWRIQAVQMPREGTIITRDDWSP
jgi:hypothetical protein